MNDFVPAWEDTPHRAYNVKSWLHSFLTSGPETVPMICWIVCGGLLTRLQELRVEGEV